MQHTVHRFFLLLLMQGLIMTGLMARDTAPSPEQTGNDCGFRVEVSDITCDNNGTPLNHDDDRYYFLLAVIEETASYDDYSATDPRVYSEDRFPANEKVFAGWYLIQDDPTVQFTVTGRTRLTRCGVSVTVNAPPTCSPPPSSLSADCREVAVFANPVGEYVVNANQFNDGSFGEEGIYSLVYSEETDQQGDPYTGELNSIIPETGAGQGQVFTAGITGVVQSLRVKSAANTTTTLHVYAGDNGSGIAGDIGTPLYSQQVTLMATPINEFPSSAIVLDTPFPVVAGMRYSFVLEGTTNLYQYDDGQTINAYQGGPPIRDYVRSVYILFDQELEADISMQINIIGPVTKTFSTDGAPATIPTELWAVDSAGRVSAEACSTNLQVLPGNAPPTAVCRPVTVQLDADGNPTINDAPFTAADLDGGSTDSDGAIDPNGFSVDVTPGCGDVANSPITVTLTVTDDDGATHDCQSQVTVLDTIAPTGTCRNGAIALNFREEFNPSGSAQFVLDSVLTSYSDNCLSIDDIDPATMIEGTQFTFACSDLGVQEHQYRFFDRPTDQDGARSFECTVRIQVVDYNRYCADPPTTSCRDLTVPQNATGEYTVSAADFDDGSAGTYGVQTLVFSDEQSVTGNGSSVFRPRPCISGQSFVATQTGTLHSIYVQVFESRSDVNVHLYELDADGNTPAITDTPDYTESGVDLFTDVARGDSPSLITLSAPFPVVEGRSYAFLIEGETTYGVTDGDSYPEGRALQNDGMSEQEVDVVFEVRFIGPTTQTFTAAPGTTEIPVEVWAVDNQGTVSEASCQANLIITPPAPTDFFLEAECAAVGGNWETRPDTRASGGRFVTIRHGLNTLANPPADDPSNYVRFTVDVPAAADHHLYARVFAPNGDDNSFWVRIDGGPWIRWWRGLTTGPNFAWKEVTESPFSLAAGTRTIDFAYREDGTQLDKIYLSPDPGLPTGFGPVADNDCTPPPPADFTAAREAECGLVGANWRTRPLPGASNGAYVEIEPGRNSLSTPPADVPDNRVLFTIDVPAGADHHLFARVRAATGKDNSFWVRVDGGQWIRWWRGLDTDNNFAWREVTGSPFTLAAGSRTVEFAYREDGTLLDKIVLTTNATRPSGFGPAAPAGCSPPPPPPPMPDEYVLEAECGQVGSNWLTRSGSSTSNGGYVEIRSGFNSLSAPPADDPANQVRFNVDVQLAGDYHLFGRVRAPSGSANSFWVRIDDGAWIRWWRGLDTDNNFAWREVTESPFDLAVGPHTITFAYREDGTQLDKLILKLDGEAPSGVGPAATNCDNTRPNLRASAPAPRGTGLQDGAVPTLRLYPNPAGSEINLLPEHFAGGQVMVMVFNTVGRPVLQRKLATGMTSRVDVSSLAAGSYFVRVTSGEGSIVRQLTVR